MTTSPPVNFSFYRERLRVPAETLGMNFVRHHSHILPIEYFDAACDAGPSSPQETMQSRLGLCGAHSLKTLKTLNAVG